MSKYDSERRALGKRSVWGVIASMLTGGLGIAVGAMLLFAWVADEVNEGDTLRFDNAIRSLVHDHAAVWITPLMQAFSFLGSTAFLTLAVLAVLLILFRTGHKHSAILLSITMVGAAILNFALKVCFVRDRPLPYFDTPLPSSYSFPSGHALYALCFYGSLAWIWAAHSVERSKKVVVWATAILLIFFIGLSRVYLGVHYPSDVIAGYLAAVVWVFAVFGADAWLGNRGSAKRSV